MVWRKYLPLRSGDAGPATFSSKKETNEFFDAAPPHESEKLETETYRVAEWLHDRADTVLQRKSPKENVGLQRNDIVLLILSPIAEYEQPLTLGDLAQDSKGRAQDECDAALVAKLLAVDARFGGLKDGLLDGKEENGFPTADA